PAPSANSAWRCPASMSKTWSAMRRRLMSNRPSRVPPGGVARTVRPPRPSPVHDLDSFGAIPLESKVARFAGSLAADRPAGWRLGPVEAKGHAGQDPDELGLRTAAPAG